MCVTHHQLPMQGGTLIPCPGTHRDGWEQEAESDLTVTEIPGLCVQDPKAEGWVQPWRWDPKGLFAVGSALLGVSGVGPKGAGKVLVAGDSPAKAPQVDVPRAGEV